MREVEETLAHNLREVREKKGYTLKDVVTVLYNLAKFYGVSVDRFFWK